MPNVIQALRLFRKTPRFTLLVAMILAFGIGANTSVFTLVNAALLRPLPFRDASRLASVEAIDRSGGDVSGCLSYPHFEMLAARSRAYTGLAAFTNETFGLSTGGQVLEVQAARVSPNFFSLLDVKPALGRAFLAEEGTPAGRPVALISADLQHQRFGGDPKVLGKTVALDSRPFTIVGVLPASFRFGLLGTATGIWIPRIDELSLASAQQIQGGTCYLEAVARLASGVSFEQAQAEMRVLDRQYDREFSKMGDADPSRPVEVLPLRAKLIGSSRSVFLMLTAAVALVLLIACANVAGLLLTRGLSRRREVAIRIALGAARGQLVVQFLLESLLLGLLGGVGGLLLSLAATRGLVQLAAQTLAWPPESPPVDLHVLGFSVAISIFTGLFCGLTPALQFSKPDVVGSLREEGRGTAGARSHHGSRNLLVAGQIALSLMLLVTAGLLVRSFLLLATRSPGFNPEKVLTMSVALPPSKYTRPDQMIDFFDRLVRAVETLPGVKAAAVSSALPANVARLTPILVEGQPALPIPQRPIIIAQTFTPAYLRVMQIPLISGRFFNPFDKHDSAPVIVVNHSLARRFFGSQNPVGKHVWVGRRTTPAQIVGVIGDVKNVSLSLDPQPEFNLPFSQLPWGRMNLLIRTAVNPKSVADGARREVAKLDRDLPVTDVRTMDELLTQASAKPRGLVIVLVGFAAFAFGLAIIGLYGAISYSVTQRTQEIGVRMALGGTRAHVVGLVLKYGAAVAIAGIAAGTACSLLMTSIMTKLVYGISTRDPVTFALVALIFLMCALVASYIPARRAMKVDILQALKD